MIFLKQSTASQAILIGPFVDSADGVTSETGLTISNTDIRLSKNGGNMAAKNSGGGTHDENGWYTITLDATDTDTVGTLQISVIESGALPVFIDVQVLEEKVYDGLFAASADFLSPAATAALEDQYDGTGLIGDSYPASQEQVGSISVGAGGLSIDAESFTLTTGTQSSGTVADTEELDGVKHTITPSGSEIDCYYQFDVGTNGTATEAVWDGQVGNSGDEVEVFGYDWVSTSFKQIGSIAGKNNNNNVERAFILTSAMTGTGANIGKVRVQFTSDGGDVAVDLNTDRILCEYTSVAAERLILHTGLAQTGSTNTVTMDSGASANDSYYKHARILVAGGTGSEQERIVVEYNGTTKIATVAPPWITTPDSTSVLEVLPGTAHAETNSKTVKVGLAQAATSTTITLASDASAVNDYYNDDIVEIDYGTGEGQARVITDYVGSTKVATVSPAWITTPDTTSEYLVEEALVVVGKMETDTLTADALATDAVSEVADGVWDEALSGHNTGGSAGKALRQVKEAGVSEESTVNDGSATTTSFITSLSETTDDHYIDVSVVFIDGDLVGQSRPVLSYDGGTKTLTFDEAFTEAPSNGDGFIIKTDHTHPISQIFTTQMTEAYAADGTAPTLAQAIFNLQQTLGDFSISGTTITVKKLDGSTTAMTYTLDDATTPTSRTRAT